MITEIRVPKMGMSQGEVTVVSLSLEHGAPVSKDDLILTIETAKVTYEIQAPESGFVYYLKAVKDKAQIGDVLAVVADSPEAWEDYLDSGADEGAAGAEPDAVGVSLSFDDDDEDEPPSQEPSDPSDAPLPQGEARERIPFIGMRKTIADNLFRSLQGSAQLTIVSETDMTEMAAFREERLQRDPGNRITYVDMLVKVLASALLEFPVLNASLVGDEILCWKDVNIGVAVALDEGLVVPVVRNADRKSLDEISLEVKDLAARARSGELAPEDYRGGTFTLTSGGRVETDIITPILNPPESAILAVGKIAPRPAVKDGELVVRTMTHLCLTHDHRVVDGVPASLFQGRVKEIIEDGAQLRGVLER